MLPKPAHQLTEADLHALVEARVTEDDRLEYKQDMYGQGERDTREMCRDVASLANREGGVILIGVEEDHAGAAKAIVGVVGDKLDERIISSVQSNIVRRIAGFSVKGIPLSNSRNVLALDIPRSLSSPHMVTFQGDNRFWRRHGRQRVPMSIDEIEAAMTQKISGGASIESFFVTQARRNRMARCMVLQAAPVFMGEELFGVRDASIHNMLAYPPKIETSNISCNYFHNQPRPSLDGLLVENRESGQVSTSLQLFRHGYLDYRAVNFTGMRNPSNDRPAIPSTIILHLTYSFIHLFHSLMSYAGVSGPMVFSLTLRGVTGHELALPPRLSFSGRSENAWSEPELRLHSIYADDIQNDLDQLVQAMNDRLWNAFGFERCLLLTEDGSFVGTN